MLRRAKDEMLRPQGAALRTVRLVWSVCFAERRGQKQRRTELWRLQRLRMCALLPQRAAKLALGYPPKAMTRQVLWLMQSVVVLLTTRIQLH